MTDPIRPGGFPSRSRRDRVVLLSIAGVAAVSVASFFVGRASVDNSACRAIQEVAVKERAETLAMPEPGPTSTSDGREKTAGFRRYAALVHSRPECFSGTERAEADAVTQQLAGLP